MERSGRPVLSYANPLFPFVLVVQCSNTASRTCSRVIIANKSLKFRQTVYKRLPFMINRRFSSKLSVYVSNSSTREFAQDQESIRRQGGRFHALEMWIWRLSYLREIIGQQLPEMSEKFATTFILFLLLICYFSRPGYGSPVRYT